MTTTTATSLDGPEAGPAADTAPSGRAPTQVSALVGLAALGTGLALWAWPAVARWVGLSPSTRLANTLGPVVVVALLAAAAPHLVRAVSWRTGRERLAWLAFTVGAGLWLVANTTWAFWLALGSRPDVATPADPAFVAAGLVMVAGLALLPSAPGSARLDRRLDLAIVVVGALAITWSVFGDRAAAGAVASDDGLALGASSSAIVVAMVGIAIAVGVLVRAAPARHPERRAMATGAVLAVVGDLVFYVEILGSGPDTSTAPATALTSAGAVMFLVGARRAAAPASHAVDPTELASVERRIRVALPLAAIAGTFVAVVVDRYHEPAVDPVMVGLAIGSAVLASIRLGLLEQHSEELLGALDEAALALERQTRTDPLTGLGNRSGLLERLDELLGSPTAGGVALCFIDLDHFKGVNDGLGHAAGDELLVGVARRLAAAFDGDVFRLGGDEFVGLRGGLEEDRLGELAGDLAEAVLATFRSPLEVDGSPMAVTASIGVATSRPRRDGPDRRSDRATSLLRRADLALQRAKATGRSTWSAYDPTLQSWADQRLELRLDLHRAVAHGAIRVRYRPVADTTTGAVVAWLAEDHWPGSTLGDLERHDYATVLAEEGLTGEIVRRTVELACRDHGVLDAEARRRNEPLGGTGAGTACGTGAAGPVPVTVVVPRHDLLRGDLPDRVADALRAHGVPPAALRLRLDEDALLDDGAVVPIDRLRQLGVELVAGAFGSGPSSLRLLGDYPAGTIELDRELVLAATAAPVDGGDRSAAAAPDVAVVTAVVALAGELGLHVCADGVADPAGARRLADLGVGSAAGPWAGPPVRAAAAALPPWLDGRGTAP